MGTFQSQICDSLGFPGANIENNRFFSTKIPHGGPNGATKTKVFANCMFGDLRAQLGFQNIFLLGRSITPSLHGRLPRLAKKHVGFFSLPCKIGFPWLKTNGFHVAYVRLITFRIFGSNMDICG